MEALFQTKMYVENVVRLLLAAKKDNCIIFVFELEELKKQMYMLHFVDEHYHNRGNLTVRCDVIKEILEKLPELSSNFRIVITDSIESDKVKNRGSGASLWSNLYNYIFKWNKLE